MGNLLRLLSSDSDGSCCGMPENLDVFVDFENASVSTKNPKPLSDLGSNIMITLYQIIIALYNDQSLIANHRRNRIVYRNR